MNGQISTRKLTILLLLAAPDAEGNDRAAIVGTTRMQKLTFLVMDDTGDFLREDDVFKFDFAFEADKFGPADLDIYQDLELLKATKWIQIDGETGINAGGGPYDQSDVTSGSPLLPEAEGEEIEVSFDYLMGDHSEEIDLAVAEKEYDKTYAITDSGVSRLDKISRSLAVKRDKFNRLVGACEGVKREYGDWPLNRLLKHVYTQHPETTIKSEIRDRVLH